MSIVKELFNLWRYGDLEFCLGIFKRYQAEVEEANNINQKMDALGFIEKGKLLTSYPAHHIGTALLLANEYGLQFNVGTTFNDCRAILPRSKWRREINRNVPLTALAFFTVPESYEQIEDFQGISDRIEIAICRCLIAARTAGVI